MQVEATEVEHDGQHGDGGPGDDVYGAAVSGFRPGALVDYYVSAVSAASSGGGTAFEPRAAAHAPEHFRVQWQTGASDALINEFVAKNNVGVRDEAMQFEGRIELHNKGATPVVVSGMYLTDDLTKPTKWKIPTGPSIPPGATLLVWCDEDSVDGPLHANFKLGAGGEEIGLFAIDGATLLGSTRFGSQQADIATGRLLDGGQPWVTFPSPSPRQPNELGACGTRSYSALDPRWHRLTRALTGLPKIGTSPALTVAGGPPSGSSVLLLDAWFGYVDLTFGPLALLLDPNQLVGPFTLPLDSTGAGRVVLPIPNCGSIPGTKANLQQFAVDGAGLTASNALELVFCR